MPAFGPGGQAFDSVRVPSKIVFALFVQGRGPGQDLLRLEVRRQIETPIPTIQTPDRSGLPSAERGAGAERLGLPSGVRVSPGWGDSATALSEKCSSRTGSSRSSASVCPLPPHRQNLTGASRNAYMSRHNNSRCVGVEQWNGSHQAVGCSDYLICRAGDRYRDRFTKCKPRHRHRELLAFLRRI